MTGEESLISGAFLKRLSKASALADAQFNEAEKIVTYTMGIGGTHPQREVIIAMVMQTLATNLNAVISTNSQ